MTHAHIPGQQNLRPWEGILAKVPLALGCARFNWHLSLVEDRRSKGLVWVLESPPPKNSPSGKAAMHQHKGLQKMQLHSPGHYQGSNTPS